ncbi:MAG TPA: hypothetical protein VLB51_03170 [Methylomirabilota bacterium]|nr:hypothetical protein [Methylomirabilota bacterium]
MTPSPKALLASPTAPWLAAAVMLVLCLPALRVGWVADDYYHRAILHGKGAPAALDDPLRDLFVFVPDDARADTLRDVGVVPWWGDPDLSLGFLRPVTAATHILDHRLWPDHPALHHAQSMLWFAAAVVLVGLTYRRIHGLTATAGLAVLLFALEDAHAMPIGWIANRNATVALVFGLLALCAHIEWRRRGQPVWLGAALTSFAIGLLAGEAVVGLLAYLVSWQLTMDKGGWPRRLAALIPYATLLAGWRLAYDALGYGCTGSDLYIDPASEPLAFAGALVERVPVMLGGLWSQASVDLWAVLDRPGRVVFLGGSVVLCAALAVLLARLIRSAREARFWALGTVLSLVPVAAAFPMNRLLLVAGIGAFGLLSMLAAEVGLLEMPPRDRRPWVRRTARALLVLHLPVAALLLLGSILFLPVFNAMFTAGARWAPRDPELAAQNLIFVTGHEFPSVYTYLIRLTDDGAPVPRRIAILGPMSADVTVTREDEHTLVVDADDGWLRMSIDRLMRRADAHFVRSQRVPTALFEAEIRRVSADGRPMTVAFEFRQPLSSPSHRWVAWRNGRLEGFPLPATGEASRLAKVPLVSLE